MENPIKMDDLGVPLFSETSRSYSGGFNLFLIVSPENAPEISPVFTCMTQLPETFSDEFFNV